MLADDPLWYKDAIIYEVHVKAFFDSNDDGIGDFAGLTQKLDYLQDLGVTAIWLLPFYPSPLRDDGYDISDYTERSSRLRHHARFRRFVREAHRRNLRVITELVINHTSDQHPWFQRARRAKPGSQAPRLVCVERHRPEVSRIPESYSPTPSRPTGPGIRLPKRITGIGFSRISRISISTIRRCSRQSSSVMRFWLDTGVDGVRLDAIPYLCEREGTNNENIPETHAVLKRMRARAGLRATRTGCCWPRPTSGRKTCSTISATATNATWAFIFR